jgi:folate-dependent phosphoribosylglycinamide formyltransferase PurN
MLEKLRKRWGVNNWNLVLILCTFAMGGSLCGYSARKLLTIIYLENKAAWVLLYIFLVTVLWPLAVMLVSVPLGQFSFFRRYILRIWSKMTKNGAKKGKNDLKLAIFASGKGSNAANIMQYFDGHPGVSVGLVVCNNANAGVVEIANKYQVPVLLINRQSLGNPKECLAALQQAGIDYLVLAGFLWKLPQHIIEAYPSKILNIHPALLPHYGGKGMYGQHVHEAVIAAKESQSGITIHIVDEHYDNGDIVFQAACTIDAAETSESLAAKIHALEQAHFPRVIEQYLQNQR